MAKLAGNVTIPAGVLALSGILFAVLLLTGLFFFDLFNTELDVGKLGTGDRAEKPSAQKREILCSSVGELYTDFREEDVWDRNRILAGGIMAFLAISFFIAGFLSMVCSGCEARGSLYTEMTPCFMYAAGICLLGAVIFAVWLFLDYRKNFSSAMDVTRIIKDALFTDIQDERQAICCFKFLNTLLDKEVSDEALDRIKTVAKDHPDMTGGRICITLVLNDLTEDCDVTKYSEVGKRSLSVLRELYGTP